MKKDTTAALGLILAAALLAGCGETESFAQVKPQKSEERLVWEAYAPLVEHEAKYAGAVQADGEDGVRAVTSSVGGERFVKTEQAERPGQGKGSAAGQPPESGEQDYQEVTDIHLEPVTYGEEERFVLGDSTYLIMEPRRENGNSKTAVSNTAKKLNALQEEYPDIPIYSYFVNRAADMDWYEQDGIKVFSYADYFEKSLGTDTSVKSGQYRLRDVQHYMDTGYKTDFHVNNRGSYEVYQDIYQMLAADMELSDMLVPTGEDDYDNLRFVGLSGGASLDFTEKQTDVFRTYRYELGDYDSYVDGKETVIGLEKEYAQGKIVRDVDFPHQFSYYGGQSGIVEFDFHHAERPNLLLISDSQGRPSRKLLASHFNRTVFLDDVQYRSLDLGQIIQDNQIGVILLMGQESMFEWYGK